MRTKMSSRGRKQLLWSSDCGQGPEDCFWQTDQQLQKPGGHTLRVRVMVRAIDFAQRKGGGAENAEVENAGTITHGKLSEEKTDTSSVS